MSKSRPYHDDNIRWIELFFMAGVVHYEDEPETMTVDEFIKDVERRLSLGEKSLPEGWINTICFGFCIYKGSDKCGGCRGKSLYIDCRGTCANAVFKCEECESAEHYKGRP